MSKTDPGIKKSNKNGWHSRNDIYNMPEYKELLSLLFKMQNEIFKEEGLEPSPHIGNMWANINPKGGYNTSHIHSNSLWSGVYYIKADSNSGHLKIDDPRAAASMCRPRQKPGPAPSRLWRETHFEPKAGRLIMFPSWLTHCVDPNKSNDIRISVSFNFMQKCFVI